MPSLDWNDTEAIFNNGSTLIPLQNQSVGMILFIVFALFAPAFGCTIFLLLQFGRLQYFQ